MITTKIAKWGNSLALRIPHGIAEKYRFSEGAFVTVRGMRTGALITPVFQRRTRNKLPTLKAALAKFTPEMTELVDWGKDIGKEIIE